MTQQNAAFEEQFGGIPAVWLRFNQFEAAVIPSVGANLVAFRDTEKGFRYLREPNQDQMDEFMAAPAVYGIRFFLHRTVMRMDVSPGMVKFISCL